MTGISTENSRRSSEKMKKSIAKIFKSIYRKDRAVFGADKENNPLPADYKNKEQSPVFQKAKIIFPSIEKLVYAGEILGISRNLKICEVESYVSAAEPVVARAARPKLILWQPTKRREGLSGWHFNPFTLASYQSGIAVAEDQEYWQKWSKHARRHRKRHLNDKSYEIVRTDLDTFVAAYEKCGKLDLVTRAMFVRGLKINARNYQDDMHLYAARYKKDGKIFAGLAAVDHPEISMSRNYISFINRDEKNTSAGYGLIDRWFGECLRAKIKFLNFGIIWKKGDPKAWQGYSQFKKQFNIHVTRYPRPLFKIVL
jgi:hypothetical protein